MKNGLIYENDRLIYYKDDIPCHAGVIKVDGDIYYIGSGGQAVKGEHIVHRTMANDILKRGTYTFGDDYKLVEGSYVAPYKKYHKRKCRQRGLTALIIIVASLVILTGLFFVESKYGFWGIVATEAPESTAPIFTISIADQEITLCSVAAKYEYDGSLTLSQAVRTGNPYRPMQIPYKLTDTPGVLTISEDAQLQNGQTYDLAINQVSFLIDNLKTDTTYFYKLVVGDQEQSGSFRTAASTRFVSIPGLVNTRDIGGYTTLDGKRVKQGLLIRGVELDGLVNAAYFIPEKNLESVKETFGFAYDMDLRSASIYTGAYTSRLDIPHKFYDAPLYGSIFDNTYKESLRQIFSDLADPQKYPMYLHCTWGTDRTGTVVFLLQGILNMSQEAMLREYELTGYTKPEIVGNGKMDIVISGLQSYEGETLQEKIVTYLTTVIGVTEEEIASIRNIYLES